MDSLDRALALWRAQPTRGHAELVRRASALIRREPLRWNEWFEVEARADASDIDRLLHALDPMGGLAQLARRAADPRIVEGMIAMLEARTFDWGAVSDIWKPLFQIFESGDATFAPRLRAIAARERAATTRMASRLAPKLDEIADTLEAREEPDADSPESRALAMELDGLEARRRALEEDALALFDAVWAAPDDDAPRFVLADFLNEHTEPRGELIALQLAQHAGKLGAAGRKRAKKLLDRNKRAWIGPIAPLVHATDARFERGFIVSCRLKPDAELERKLGDHPAWSTIREYNVHPLEVGTNAHLDLVRMLRAYGAHERPLLIRGIA
ncbi:MAG TPA: TIGR02996 domain-containing protein [Kofleriaceae bacterium]|jgi:uncharacterized protein (TIGR02996 family)